MNPPRLAALCAPLLAALAIFAAVPWWQWEDGLMPLRVALAACYGVTAIAALVVAAQLRHPDPACPLGEVAR